MTPRYAPTRSCGVVLDVAEWLDPIDPRRTLAVGQLGSERCTPLTGRAMDVVGLPARPVVRLPAGRRQGADHHVGTRPVEEGTLVVDGPLGRRWVAQQAVQPGHQRGDAGAARRDPWVPVEDGPHLARHPLGCRVQHVLGHDRVVAPGEFGRSCGLGRGAEDVAHLRRLGQWMEVCRSAGCRCRPGCVPGLKAPLGLGVARQPDRA